MTNYHIVALHSLSTETSPGEIVVGELYGRYHGLSYTNEDKTQIHHLDPDIRPQVLEIQPDDYVEDNYVVYLDNGHKMTIPGWAYIVDEVQD